MFFFGMHLRYCPWGSYLPQPQPELYSCSFCSEARIPRNIAVWYYRYSHVSAGQKEMLLDILQMNLRIEQVNNANGRNRQAEAFVVCQLWHSDGGNGSTVAFETNTMTSSIN